MERTEHLLQGASGNRTEISLESELLHPMGRSVMRYSNGHDTDHIALSPLPGLRKTHLPCR